MFALAAYIAAVYPAGPDPMIKIGTLSVASFAIKLFLEHTKINRLHYLNDIDCTQNRIIWG
jgi:hypothetical protein